MMGEIVQMNGKLNDHSGITPRIFEYLFNRIREVKYYIYEYTRFFY